MTTTYNYYGTGLDHQAAAPPNENYSFGLLYQILTGPSAVLQNLTLAYDAVGNPKTMNPGDHTSEGLNFSYNELDQLTQMSGSASESYSNYIQGTFDIGNLLAKGATTLTYGNSAVPHAPSSASGIGSYTYDGNGNRVSDPTYSYTYDAENHLTLLKQGSTTVLQNSYDGDGARLVCAVTGGATTHYIGDWYENDFNSNTPTVYYPFNGVPVAMKKGSTLTYLHHDQVGSLVSATSASGAEVASARFWPFGSLRSSTGTLPTDRLFTGQIRDLGSDAFYFFKARYYDATIGKFQTPDTIVPGAGNPQALNRYAYALNNPLKFVDPSGHYVMLVGGFSTNQSWVENNMKQLVAAAGLDPKSAQLGVDYGIFDWSGGGSSLSQSLHSSIDPVGTQVGSLISQLAGKKDVTLIGHSKGGQLVLEYMAAMAAGVIAANNNITGAVAINAPVNNATALLPVIGNIAEWRLANAAGRMSARGVAAKIYNIYTPRDTVNGPLTVGGVNSVAHASGNDEGLLNTWFLNHSQSDVRVTIIQAAA